MPQRLRWSAFVNRLNERGYRLLDTQYVTSHLTNVRGGRNIAAEVYASLEAGACAGLQVCLNGR